MATEKTATFGIKIPVETNADASATSVDALRKRITESQDAVKSYGATLRNLRGASDEVKAAKEKLKAAMSAEREAISRDTLAIGKQGKSLIDHSKKAKEAATKIDAIKDALNTAGGPLASASSKMETLSGLFTAAGGAAALSAAGAALLAAAFVAIGAAAIAATASLVGFILASGNQLRTMGLFREAASGSAENAKAWGNQIEDLASRVPKTRKELNELSLSLEKTFGNSRVSEKGVVDAFNAVAQASSAMGDGAGKAIEEVLSRGKMMGRMSLGINELGEALGNNAFQDVAAALAKNLGISITAAQTQLRNGYTKIDDGAKAIRDVAEKRFGKINIRMMFDLDNIVKKLKDNLEKLTSGVDLEPILAGLGKLGALFDTNTFTGALLRDMITDFGKVMTAVFVAGLPFIESFFNQMIIESLKLEVAILRLAVWVKQTFGVDFADSLFTAESAITAAKVAMGTIVAVTAAAVVVFALAVAPIVALGVAFYELFKYSMQFGEYLKTVDWGSLGSNMITGLLNGIKSAAMAVPNAIGDVVTSIKDAFTRGLIMHSPSKLFEKYGEYTVQGYVDGVDGNRDKAGDSVGKMVSLPSGGGSSGGGGAGAGPVTLELHLHFPNAKSGDDVAKTLTSGSFKAEFTRIVEEMMLGIGAPTMTPQGGVT